MDEKTALEIEQEMIANGAIVIGTTSISDWLMEGDLNEYNIADLVAEWNEDLT